MSNISLPPSLTPHRAHPFLTPRPTLLVNIMAPAEIASPAPGSNKPANSTVVDLEGLLEESDARELRTVQDHIDRKKAKRRAVAEQTPEEKQRAEERKEEQKWRVDWNRAAKKMQRLMWNWSQNREPEDEEIGVARLPQCYEEAKNLLLIEKNPNPIYAKALEVWSAKESLLAKRVERKKSSVDNLKNEIYQLIGFYSVFQGVVFTAVSQPNLLSCNNLWSPVVFSMVASFVTIGGALQKLRQIKCFQETIHLEEQSMKVVIKLTNALRRDGVHKFNFMQSSNWKPAKQSTHRFWIHVCLVIGPLLVFAVLFPLSYWTILCCPGSSPCAAPVPSSN